MKSEDKKDIPSRIDEKKEAKNSNIKENKKPFWKKHFLKLFLLLLLVVSIVWGYIANLNTAKKYEQEITALETNHQDKLNNIEGEHLKQMISTLALAVRSEMIGENMSQVNQYFIQTLKNVNVERLILVNPSNGEVILSTNKKDEGAVFDKKELVETKNAMTKVQEGSTYAATPIMGLNTQLAVLIIQSN